MTDHEMRIRLVEAMGYHRCKKYRGSPSAPWMDPDGVYASTIPNPLESDADAAGLQAWMVKLLWEVTIQHYIVAEDALWYTRVVIHSVVSGGVVAATVSEVDEPSPIYRARLALCRAVLQALDAGGQP